MSKSTPNLQVNQILFSRSLEKHRISKIGKIYFYTEVQTYSGEWYKSRHRFFIENLRADGGGWGLYLSEETVLREKEENSLKLFIAKNIGHYGTVLQRMQLEDLRKMKEIIEKYTENKD